MIEVGCYVTIGKSALTWEVMSIHNTPLNSRKAAQLKSGQTGRRRSEWVERLTYHSPPTSQ